MNPEQQKLQDNIDIKKSELNILKAKISPNQKDKEQKMELERDLKDLQKQLDDLQAIEQQTQLSTTKSETKKLEKSVDKTKADTEWAYRLIRWTTMETKLKEAGKSDSEVKEFAESIDATVRKYYDKELEGFSHKIKNSVCVWTQFAMMETMTQEGVNGTQFFEMFSQTNTSSGVAAVEWLFKSFSGGITGMLWGLNKWTKFFGLANKVENFTQFLKIHKNTLAKAEDIPELMNPAKCMDLLKNPLRDKTENIYTTPISTLLTLNKTDWVELVAGGDEEKKLKAIADNTFGAMDTKQIDGAVKAMEKSLVTADKFLDMRGTYQDKATDLLLKVKSFLDIDIPLLGKLGPLFGVNWPADVLGKRGNKKKKWVLDFVFRILGFPGGVQWVHEKYIKEEMNLAMVDDSFVKSAYGKYEAKIASDAAKTNDDAGSTWKKFESTFGGLKEEEKIFLKGKFPPQYASLKWSIVDALNESTPLSPIKINPNAVMAFAPELIVTSGAVQYVDVNKIKDKDAFADKYLAYIIPKLAGSGDQFISSASVNSNTFALAIFGNLIAEKFFVEGVNLGIVNIDEYKTPLTQEQQNAVNSSSGEAPLDGNKTLKELKNFAEAKTFAYSIFGKGPATEALITLSKGNSAAIIRTIALAKIENWLKFGAENFALIVKKNLFVRSADTWWDIWTFQIHDVNKQAATDKYNKNLDIWKKQFLPVGIRLSDTDANAAAQRDLLCWLGYVYSSPWWQKLLEELANPSLNDSQVWALMAKIQWGLVGDKMVADLANNKVSDYTKIVNFASQTKVEIAPATFEIAAKTKEEFGGSGDSIMNGFQWYANKTLFPNMEGKDSATTRSHLNVLLPNEASVAHYKKDHPWVKSYVMYYWINDLLDASSTTLKDLEEKSTWLKANAIQPVLSTLYFKPDHKLAANIQVLNGKIRDLAKKLQVPCVDFEKISDKITIGSSDDLQHPDTHWYLTMATYLQKGNLW